MSWRKQHLNVSIDKGPTFKFIEPWTGKEKTGRNLKIIADEGGTYMELEVKFRNRPGWYPNAYPIEEWNKHNANTR